ncbi:MAG TPA: VOC family protein [Chitinophagaceae bacterium]|nr:VOC family protein [Chitinophagaceae bacterium]
MKVIPLLRCNNLKESIVFYTGVLDFTLKYPAESDDEWAVDIINGDAEIILTSMDGTPRIPVVIKVNDLDALFNKYINRGLIVPNSPNSPVHNSPIDQTWGMREFYVDDPSGNTLRFAQSID